MKATRPASSTNREDHRHPAGNLVGTPLRLVGGSCVALALLSAGCGARSALTEAEPATTGPTTSLCDPALDLAKSRRFGDAQRQMATSVVVDASGHPIVAGAFTGEIAFGQTKLEGPTAPPDTELPFGGELVLRGRLFVARLADDGCNGFARTFEPAVSYPSTIELASGANDALWLTATYPGAVDFGGGLLGGSAAASGAVVELSPAGEHVWSRAFSATHKLVLSRPAPDEQGNVYVGGLWSGDLADANGVLASSPEPNEDCYYSPTEPLDPFDGFLAKLDTEGQLVWFKHLRIAGFADASWYPVSVSVVTWPSGDVALTGDVHRCQLETADLGGGPVDLGPVDHLGFVTSFDPSGNHRWVRLPHADFEPRRVEDSRVSPSGDLVLLAQRGNPGLVLGRYDISGAFQGAQEIPFDVTSQNPKLSVGPGGLSLISGLFSPSGTGNLRVHALEVGGSGEVLSKRSFGDAQVAAEYFVSGTFGASGAPLLAGGFTHAIDFGDGEMTANGQADMFLAELH